MIIELPSAEERAKLLAENADRFPERFDFRVSADGDVEDTIPVLLGNPLDDSAEWEQTIAATFKPRKFESDNAALVATCVLWPDPKTWASIVRRWPALPGGSVAKALRQKCGAALSAMAIPEKDEESPKEFQEAMAAHPSAVRRRLTLDGHQVMLAIQPPSLTVWRAFEQQLQKDDVKCWPLIRDLAMTSVVASTMSIGDVFTRWPGCVSLVALVCTSIGGAAAEFEKKTF